MYDWIPNALFDEVFPYVPPCERKPYYDDPRDRKSGFSSNINSDYFVASNVVRELVQCKSCGVYFPKSSISAECYCENCLVKIRYRR